MNLSSQIPEREEDLSSSRDHNANKGEPDTIFAPATNAGGAIAIVRISGPAAGPTLDRLVGRRPISREASLRAIRAADGEIIDHGLVLWFPAPGSYTGEDSAELHLHGGLAIVEATLRALAAAGARAAEPGEFTRRAFLAGRIDLIEAEGIADLIAAETDEQRRQALSQARGGFSVVIGQWAERIRRMLASTEAAIDFPDETVSIDTGRDDDEVRTLIGEIDTYIEQSRAAERLRDGVTIVISGAPNVGKSSLMNQLAGRDIAIVASLPGTTRDRLETNIVIAGIPVTMVDTAGTRHTDDPVEAEGVRRARNARDEADIVLLVRTPDTVTPTDFQDDGRTLLVVNQIDRCVAPDSTLGVSATRGDNLPHLHDLLAERVRKLAGRREQPGATRSRHRLALVEARSALAAAGARSEAELRSEDLRHALGSLGRLTGRVGVEDILGDIFSTFCIGK